MHPLNRHRAHRSRTGRADGGVGWAVAIAGSMAVAAVAIVVTNDPYGELSTRLSALDNGSTSDDGSYTGGAFSFESAGDGSVLAVQVDKPRAWDGDEAVLGLNRTERREVQQRLAIAGHSPGAIDGVFGDRTRRAIASYQRATGLAPTGFLDKRTIAALREHTAASYVAPAPIAQRPRTAQPRPERAAPAERSTVRTLRPRT